MLFLPFLALAVSDGRAAEWKNLTIKTQSNLNSIWFTDIKAGYVVGEGGVILKTVDGGANWTPQASNTTNDLSSVQFPTPQTGFVTIGLKSLLLKPTDGGSNWTSLTLPAGMGNSLCVLDANRIIVAGGGGIARSVDGGIKWTIGFYGGGMGVDAVHFPEAQIGYALNQKQILKSVDGGATWTTLPIDIEPTSPASLFFTSRDVGFASGSRCPRGNPGRPGG